jgi:hypothetical protein
MSKYCRPKQFNFNHWINYCFDRMSDETSCISNITLQTIWIHWIVIFEYLDRWHNWIFFSNFRSMTSSKIWNNDPFNMTYSSVKTEYWLSRMFVVVLILRRLCWRLISKILNPSRSIRFFIKAYLFLFYGRHDDKRG